VLAASVAKMTLASKFADAVLKDANAKIDAATKPEELDAAKKNLEAVQKVLPALIADGTKAVSASTSFISGLQGKITKDPLGYGKNADTMKTTIGKLPDLVKSLGNLTKTVTDTIGKATEKAKTFAK